MTNSLWRRHFLLCVAVCAAIWCVATKTFAADTKTKEVPHLGHTLYLEALKIPAFPATDKQLSPPPLASQCIFQPLAQFRVLMNVDIVKKAMTVLLSIKKPTDKTQATLAYLQSCIANGSMANSAVDSDGLAFPWNSPILPHSKNITLVSSAPAEVPVLRVSVAWNQSPSYAGSGIAARFPNSDIYPVISILVSSGGRPVLSRTTLIQFPQSLPVGGLKNFIYDETMAEMMRALKP
jgi:hypothetical protein